MKRRKSLSRNVPLKRKIPLKRGKRIRPVSVKRSKMLRAYREAKQKFLADHEFKIIRCWCCNEIIRKDDIWDFHHPFSRATMEDILRFQPVHRSCHNKIHGNPNWARENGFIFY
jgi:hypothetical protein